MNKTFLSFLKFEAQRVVLRDFSHLLQQHYCVMCKHTGTLLKLLFCFLYSGFTSETCLHISGLNVVSKKSLILIL